MKGKLAVVLMGIALLLAAAVGGYGWHRHTQQNRLLNYQIRAHALELHERTLNVDERAELAELKKRIGEMRADGVKTGDDW